MGGNKTLIDRLEKAFIVSQKQGFTAGKAHADETNHDYNKVPINYGNQPSMQTAFVFSAAGAPWKTQYWSRQVVNEVFYGLSPETGYNGDENQGLMGSLAVLMKIGLFQLTAGIELDPIYLIGSPIFDKITIASDNRYYTGKKFVIRTNNNSDRNFYIQSIQLNGKALNCTYLKHGEIVSGGLLELEMGPNPNTKLK